MNFVFEKIKKMIKEASKSKSRSFVFICAFFIFGVGVASVLFKNQEWFFWIFCLAVILGVFLSYFWKNSKKRFLILLTLFFVLGVLRFISFLPADSVDEIKFYNGREVNLAGIVASEPDSRGMSAKYVIDVYEADGQRVFGKMEMKVLKYPEYNYGDKLEMSCKLENPAENYANYLSRKNIYSVCGFPQSIKILGNEGNPFFSAVFFIKKKFSEAVFKIFPEPHASLLAGILYGGDDGLSFEISENFRNAGVSHIVAVSGYNISIVAEFIFFICALFLFFIPRRFVFWIAFAAIAGFSILSGADASVVRAGLMYFIVMFARQIGRYQGGSAGSVARGNVLVLTAAAMVAQNPKILIFDIGFQLSFLAIVGLFYLSPVLEEKISLPDTLGLKKILVETFSAIILTAPLILYYFGNFSFVAPISNLAVLFFIPPAMLFGFLSGIFGILYLPFGKIIGIIAWAILNYIILIVDFVSKIPFASVNFGRAPIVFVLALYVLIFYFVFKKNQPAEEKLSVETNGFIIEEG